MSMYLQHFKLHRPPFEMSPDPRFLYLSPQHAQALANIEFALLNRDSFVIISGEIGMGKTTLLNKVLSELNHDVVAARIAHTTLTPVELLQSILAEFGLREFDDNKVRLLQQLRGFLEHQHQEDRQVLIMVDEAQNLTLDTLEELRLVSGIEFSSVKLVSIVLAGQPGLNDLIDSPQLRQLRQRARLRQHISPLSETETYEYLRTRLELAGGSVDQIFAGDSIKEIFAVTGGVPRLINTLCDTALTGCCVENSGMVSADLIRRVIHELGWEKVAPDRAIPQPSPAPEPEAAPQGPATAADDPDPSSEDEEPVGWLLSVPPDQDEIRIPVTKLPFIIGRSIRNDFQLRSPDVSRRHVMLHADNGDLLIEDLNSSNGTLVNGTRVKASHIRPGDVIQLGSQAFIFRISPDDTTGELDDEEDTGTHPQLTIPDPDLMEGPNAAPVSRRHESKTLARDPRGRFAMRPKYGRRRRS
jgi:type II secretory pathway predicted ATPase ExeA